MRPRPLSPTTPKFYPSRHTTTASTTPALTRKNSGLDFTAQALRENIKNPSQELSESFRAAYGNTLKPHHSFVIKPIFSAAMSATPYRKDFYAKLGDNEAEVQQQLEKWLSALENIVTIIKSFEEKKEAKW